MKSIINKTTLRSLEAGIDIVDATNMYYANKEWEMKVKNGKIIEPLRVEDISPIIYYPSAMFKIGKEIFRCYRRDFQRKICWIRQINNFK